MSFELSKHTYDMLLERNILEDWVSRAINDPDWDNVGIDNNIYYFKAILEHEERILHVVVNPHVIPNKVVTVFFDRKARRQK